MFKSLSAYWMLRLRRTVGLAALGLPLLANAACQVETYELPIKMVGSRAVATVGINGTPVPLTVDSGAFFSMLTEAAATQLQLHLMRNHNLPVYGLVGGVESYVTRVDRLQLLKGEIPRVDFLVGGNEPGAGTMGLMGRNLLWFTDTEYDLAHGVIRFLFPSADCAKANMAYWAGASPVSEVDLLPEYRRTVTPKTPALRVRLKLNGSEFEALLDTGATTIVSAPAARRAGVPEAAMTPAGEMYGAGRGSTRLWTAPFERVEIGGEAILHNRLEVADFNADTFDEDMLLGIDFFLSHRIYVSKQQSKMFFTYNGGPVFFRTKSEKASAAGSGAEPAASGAQISTADEFARRGAASAARGDTESALADLNRACELDPTSADFLAQRGGLQQRLKRPAKALEDFDKALELDPAQADARAQRAWLRFQTTNRDGARSDLDTLDKALAPQAQLRFSMARLYEDLDRPAQALDQLNQWLAAHPNEMQRRGALNSRCWIRVKLGVDLNAALDDCNDAVDSDPKNPNYLDSRGWVYLRLGQLKKALADFDRSIEYRPAAAWSLYGRGLTRTRLGDAAQAEVDLAAARRAQADIDVRVARAGMMTEPVPKP